MLSTDSSDKCFKICKDNSQKGQNSFVKASTYFDLILYVLNLSTFNYWTQNNCLSGMLSLKLSAFDEAYDWLCKFQSLWNNPLNSSTPSSSKSADNLSLHHFFCISIFNQHENFPFPIHAWMILKPKSIKETGLVFKLKWSRKFLSKDRNKCMTLRSKCRICKPTKVCKTKTQLCKCTWLPIDPAVAYFRPKFNSSQCLQEAHGPRFTAALMGDFKFHSPLFTQVIIC